MTRCPTSVSLTTSFHDISLLFLSICFRTEDRGSDTPAGEIRLAEGSSSEDCKATMKIIYLMKCVFALRNPTGEAKGKDILQ